MRKSPLYIKDDLKGDSVSARDLFKIRSWICDLYQVNILYDLLNIQNSITWTNARPNVP